MPKNLYQEKNLLVRNFLVADERPTLKTLAASFFTGSEALIGYFNLEFIISPTQTNIFLRSLRRNAKN